MNQFFSTLPNIIILFIVFGCGIYGLIKGIDVFSALTRGAKKGLSTLFTLLPTLICLFSVLAAFRASGALTFLEKLLSPILSTVGIPKETMPIVLIRPFSGSAATAAGTDVISAYGADSTIGRTVAVMLSVSETTLYAIAVYLGAAGIKKSRYILPVALGVDAVTFILAAFCVRLFFGG